MEERKIERRKHTNVVFSGQMSLLGPTWHVMLKYQAQKYRASDIKAIGKLNRLYNSRNGQPS